MYCINGTAMKLLSQVNFNENTYTSIQCGLLLSMYMNYVNVIQSCIMITMSCTMNQGMDYITSTSTSTLYCQKSILTT